MKICVYGAGAIGCHVAGHLARAGLSDVSIVARGETLAAIRARGLRVVTQEGAFTAPIRAVEDPASLSVQNYVIVALKVQQVAGALGGIASLIGPNTVIIPPTTGIPYYFFHGMGGAWADRRLPEIDPDGRQWRAMPPSQVLAGVVWIGAHVISPGEVQQDGPRAGLPLGELDGQPSDRVRRLAEVLERSGIRAPVRDNIRGEIWIKFANSLCWNPLALLTLANMGQMAGTAGIVALVTSMMEEIDAVGAALGVVPSQSPARRIATTLRATSHKMSMLQDLERGRSLELASLVQSLRAAAVLTGVPTPVLDVVLALASLRETTRSVYSSPVA